MLAFTSTGVQVDGARQNGGLCLGSLGKGAFSPTGMVSLGIIHPGPVGRLALHRIA